MNGAESLFDDRIGEGEDFTVDCNTKKVRFKDGSDDSLANMVVDSSLISGFSWKDKLLGGAISNSLNGAANLNLEFEDGDIRRSNLNGIPAIDFSDHINKILIKGMELTVVVKLLGRNIGYGDLYNHITSLWKPTQSFHLMDVANGFYIVRFQSRVDYDAALTQGPWVVFGHYLTVQLWTVDFNLSRPFPCGVLAWIHFPGLPRFLSEGHGGEGIPKSSLSSETASTKKGDALLMVGEAFSPWMVVPSKGLGAARFIQGDFIKNLQGKRIEKESGLVAMVNLSDGLLGQVDDCGPGIKSRSLRDNNAGPHSALGLPRKCTGSWLEHFGSQQIMSQINNSYSLGLEGAAGIENKDPIVPISFSNDKTTSLHVNPTFKKHPELKLGLISNALDLKKHIVVTFQEKLDNKSKPKVRANPSNIPKGDGAESRKGNRHSGKSLFKSIRGREGKFRPTSSSEINQTSNLAVPKLLISFTRVFREYNWEHRPDLISLLETRVSGEKADLVIAKLGFYNSHCVKVVGFSEDIWIRWKDSVSMEVLQSHPQFVLAKVTDSSFWSLSVAISDFNAILSSSEKKGRRVSGKSCPLFGVDDNLGERISDFFGLQKGTNLGYYLGVSLFHDKVTNNTLSFVVERVHNKLFSWDASQLSLAGRVTLAQFVLLLIPSYFMQTMMVTKVQRQPSLVKIQCANLSLTEVLRSKYRVPNSLPYNLSRSRCSFLWRSISKDDPARKNNDARGVCNTIERPLYGIAWGDDAWGV
ncbi:hypothetical protein Gohar_004211 [Gossypium harknessii]|uniref:DUF4283 domain-containing protein n=1 Tax=Gossypium harknessii TaxID=34285 RepID=A0A7J9H481_9ROSI|nr:hypothetical protein [Gossypium harknessii]